MKCSSELHSTLNSSSHHSHKTQSHDLPRGISSLHSLRINFYEISQVLSNRAWFICLTFLCAAFYPQSLIFAQVADVPPNYQLVEHHEEPIPPLDPTGKLLTVDLYRESGSIQVGDRVSFYLVIKYGDGLTPSPGLAHDGVVLLKLPDNGSAKYVEDSKIIEAKDNFLNAWIDTQDNATLAFALSLAEQFFPWGKFNKLPKPSELGAKTGRSFGQFMTNFLLQRDYTIGSERDPTIFCDTCGGNTAVFIVPGIRCAKTDGLRFKFDLDFKAPDFHRLDYFVHVWPTENNCISFELAGLNLFTNAVFVDYPTATGTLDVQATEAAGEIFVDGVLEGTGTVNKLFAPGTYEVSFGDVANFHTPSSKTVEIRSATVTAVTGIYVGSTCSYTVTPATVSVGSAGGSFGFTLNTNPGCIWEVESDVPWMSIDLVSSGHSTTNLTYTVDPAEEDANRTGTLSISHIETVIPTILTIEQSSASCTLSLLPDPNERLHESQPDSTGGIGIVTPEGCTWSIASDSPWLHIDNISATGDGSGTILYSIDEYEGTGAPDPREGLITVTGESETKTFTIQQSRGGCTFGFTPATVPPASSTGEMNSSVTLDTENGCAWDTDIQYLVGSDWLTINFGNSGTAGGQLIYTIDPNPSPDSRSAEVFFIQDPSVRLTITQDPAPNSAPIAGNNTAFAQIEEDIIIDVLDNDSDADPDDTLTISDPGGHPDAVIDKNGLEQITFRSSFPNSDTITFNYTITDGNDNFDTAQVTVIKTDGPVIVTRDDERTTFENQTITIKVLENDDPAEMGSDLSINEVFFDPAACDCDAIPNAQDITFVAPEDIGGTEVVITFTYTAKDEEMPPRISQEAEVRVRVLPPSDDTLYVVDQAGNDTVRQLNAITGEILPPFIISGSGIEELNQPSGFAVDKHNGNFYLSDTNNDRIVVYGPAGNFITEITDTLLESPHGLALHPETADRKLYVASQGEEKILVFDPENGTRENIIDLDPDDNKVRPPWGIAFLNGNLYITTPGGLNSIFQYEFGPPAVLTQLLTRAGGFGFRGIAFDTSGNLYVAASHDPGPGQIDRDEISRYRFEGTSLEPFPIEDNPIDPEHATFVKHFFCETPECIPRVELNEPTGIAFDEFGTLFVADRGSAPRTIFRFDENGDYLDIPNGEGGFPNDDNFARADAILIASPAPPNNPPFASDNSAEIPEDQTLLNFNVVDDDFDDFNIKLLISCEDPIAADHGEVTCNTANGTISYEPDAHYNGPDSFSYKIQDNLAQEDQGLVEVTVLAVNDPPSASAFNAGSINEDALVPLAINLLGSNVVDVDLPNDTLSLLTVGNVSDEGGVITEIGAGMVEFLPKENFSGTDRFSYTIQDSSGETSSAFASVSVLAANDQPVAIDDDGNSIFADNVLVIDVLDNDIDIDDDLLTVTDVNGTPIDSLTPPVVLPRGAEVTMDGDGNLIYDPSQSTEFQMLQAGEVSDPDDDFEYQISDGDLPSASPATVSVRVIGVNDPPFADDDGEGGGDEISTSANEPILIDTLLDDDTDVDISDTLSISNVNFSGSLGIVTNNGDNTVTYDPNGAFDYLEDGETATDTFEYTISDGNGGSDSATVTITINGVSAFDPSQISGLQLWLDASDSSTIHPIGSTMVSEWQDKSGNGNHVEQADPASQPELVAEVLNDKSVLHFSGGQFLSTPMPIAELNPTEFSIFTVARTGISEIYHGVVSNIAANNAGGFNVQLGTTNKVGGLLIDGLANSADYLNSGITPVQNQWYRQNINHDGSTANLYVDGILKDTSSKQLTYDEPTPKPLVVGRFYTNLAARQLNGDLAEIILFDRMLNEMERQQVQDYLDAKWTEDDFPGAPTGLAANPVSDSTINLSWNAPSNDGGSPIVGYKIERKEIGVDPDFVLHIADTGTAISAYIDTGLSASTTYEYRISAINTSMGSGDPSVPVGADTLAAGSAFDLTQIPGLQLWLDASDSSTIHPIGSTLVSEWQDKSGNGNHVEQEDSASQPELVTDVLNENSVLHFSGGQSLSTPMPIAELNPTEFSIFTVARTGISEIYHGVVSNIAANNAGGFNVQLGTTNKVGGLLIDGLANSADYLNSGITPVQNQWYRQNINHDGFTANLYVDGILKDTSSKQLTYDEPTPKPLVVGRFYTNLAARQLNGDLAEIILFDRMLNEMERQQVQDYLDAKWTEDDFPGAPTGLAANPVSDSTINLSWNAPSNDGGSPIVGYKIERKEIGVDPDFVLHIADTGTAISAYIDTGLSASTTYEYRISAINTSMGSGDPSVPVGADTLAAGSAFDLTQIPGLQLWLDADDSLTTIHPIGSTMVSEWQDKSGNGNHVEQADSASQPELVAAVLNDKSVLHFSGGQSLRTPMPIAELNPTEFSIFTVARTGILEIYHGVVSNIAANNAGGFNVQLGVTNKVGGLLFDGLDNSSNYLNSGITPVENQWYRQNINHDGSTANLYVDGIFEDTSNKKVTYDAPTPFAVGRFYTGLAAWQFNGDLAEIILFDRMLNEMERQQVQDYLDTKWGF